MRVKSNYTEKIDLHLHAYKLKYTYVNHQHGESAAAGRVLPISSGQVVDLNGIPGLNRLSAI